MSDIELREKVAIAIFAAAVSAAVSDAADSWNNIEEETRAIYRDMADAAILVQQENGVGTSGRICPDCGNGQILVHIENGDYSCPKLK